MFGAFIRTLIAICLLALAYYLTIWVLGAVGVNLPHMVTVILGVLFVLVAILIIYRFWAPYLGQVNIWGGPPCVVLALFLSACQPSPTVSPVLVMPEKVQAACQVLSWAVPIASRYIGTSPEVQRYVDAAGPALASCAAGNAGAAIVDMAVALQDLLARRGVRPPAGVPVLRRGP